MSGIVTWPAVAAHDVPSLRDGERSALNRCMAVWQQHLAKNVEKERYYFQKVRPKAVKDATPDALKGVEFVSGWPTKAVDCLVDRSKLLGFTSEGDAAQLVQQVADENNLTDVYRMAATSQLVNSVSFLTISGGAEGEPSSLIGAHPANSAAAVWDPRLRRIECGATIIEMGPDASGVSVPTWVNIYLPDSTVRMRSLNGKWTVDRDEHGMGCPAMVPMAYHPTLSRPFGRSRISAAVRSCTDRALQTVFRMDASACFYTWPQRVLAGVDKKDIKALAAKKMETWMDRFMLVSLNRQGDTPSYFQMPQMSMSPHTEQLETIAKQFCGEAGIPLNELGIVFSNPSSAEAIREAEGALIAEAEYLNDANGAALRKLGLMMLAQERGTPMDALTASDMTLRARFRDPEHPSRAQMADYAMKLASVVPGYSSTRQFWLDQGKSPDDADAILREIRRAQAAQVLQDVLQ